MVEMGSLHDASDAQQPHVPIVRVVDDDDKVRRSWQFVLEGEGWQYRLMRAPYGFCRRTIRRSPVASFVTCVCLR